MTDIKFTNFSQSNSETASTTGESPTIQKTLIIFDFDDTLFCTKYLSSFSLSYKDIFAFESSIEQINPCLFKEVKELEQTIIELFINLQNDNYDVVIVSNADLKWINNCLTHFLEDFKEYINENNIKVYSAKNMFSNIPLNSSNTKLSKFSQGWKTKCFEKVIKDLYLKEAENIFIEGNIDLKVLSIGDGEDEKEAVFKLNKSKFNFCQNLNCKFLRMIEYPSASSIMIQLEYLKSNINEILDSNKTHYKMVIEIVGGMTEIKCIPKNRKIKKKQIKKFVNSKNINKVKTQLENKDFFLCTQLNDFKQDEFDLNKLDDYFNYEDDIHRRNLFLGKKFF